MRYICTNRYKDHGVFKEEDVDRGLVEIPDAFGKLENRRVALCPICGVIAKELRA